MVFSLVSDKCESSSRKLSSSRLRVEHGCFEQHSCRCLPPLVAVAEAKPDGSNGSRRVTFPKDLNRRIGRHPAQWVPRRSAQTLTNVFLRSLFDDGRGAMPSNRPRLLFPRRCGQGLLVSANVCFTGRLPSVKLMLLDLKWRTTL